jgi:hypothetical protein
MFSDYYYAGLRAYDDCNKSFYQCNACILVTEGSTLRQIARMAWCVMRCYAVELQLGLGSTFMSCGYMWSASFDPSASPTKVPFTSPVTITIRSLTGTCESNGKSQRSA